MTHPDLGELAAIVIPIVLEIAAIILFIAAITVFAALATGEI